VLGRPAAIVAALLLALVALVALVGLAGPASAHAVLDSASPEQGGSVASAPASVELHFDEQVIVNARSLQVLDPAGERVDDGVATHPGGDGAAVTVALRPGLPSASYAVVWRVVSTDGHPVSGTYSFGVGVPAGASPDAAAAGGSPLVGAIHAVARGVAYTGLVLLVGGVAFLVVLWPAGAEQRRPRRVVTTGWGLVAVSSAALFLLEGPYGTGLGLSSALDPAVLSETLSSRYGKLVLVRLLLLALAVPVLRRLRERGSSSDLLGLAATLLLTFSLVGHPGVGRQVPLAVAVDAVHLAAACVWLGGLAVLAAGLLRPATAEVGELRAVLPGWHRLAVAAVAVLVVTGTYASWREVATLPALPATDYGRLLLVKLGAFAVLLALADQGRRWVRRHTRARLVAFAATDVAAAQVSTGLAGAPPEPTSLAVRGLRRSVGVELAVGAVVLGVTAVLVASAPARDTYSGSFASTVTAVGVDGGALTVQFDVDHTSRTPGEMHVYTYTPEGRVQPVASVNGLLVEQATGLGPVRVAFVDTGPGHATGRGVVLPGPGHWVLTLQIRVGDTQGYAATTAWDVR